MGILDRMYFERRRLGVVTVLAFIAGALLYSNIPANGALPVSLIAGGLYAAVVGSIAILTCLFLPALRFMLESIALSRVLVGIAAWQSPDVAMALVGSPLLMAMLVVSLGAILSRTFHGNMQRNSTAARRLGVLPDSLFQRHPPVLVAPTTWQMQFVNWIDAARPQGPVASAA